MAQPSAASVASPDALLVTEEGHAFWGRSCGAPGERACELIFNTAMTGYQEILTDPSYCGQGVVMTYPQIGNYGVAKEDDESSRCWAEALLIRQLAPRSSSWRAHQDLGSYLQERNVVAMEGLDTRELTLLLREKGSLRAVLSTECLDPPTLESKARAHPPLEGRDLVRQVSCSEPYVWEQGIPSEYAISGLVTSSSQSLPLVCMDFGIKRNILRSLVEAGFKPTVVPATTSAAEILAYDSAGVFLSNGPGDPAAVDYIHRTVRELAAAGVPILGICLGHQILAHAFGAKTLKMKFGHHGANHPVIETTTGRIDITSQNHSFAVDPKSLAGTNLEITHVNGNDQTVAGMRHKDLPIFSVQYHPEAAPGPRDAAHLFQRFRSLVSDRQSCSTG